jgi:hypothetical protein
LSSESNEKKKERKRGEMNTGPSCHSLPVPDGRKKMKGRK